MPELLISRKDGELLLSVDLTGRMKLTVGRSPRCDLTLEAPAVSRRHAVLVEHGGNWMLIDTGSTTGTFAGAERARCIQLAEDQWARIGPAYFWLDRSADGAAAPPVETENPLPSSADILGPGSLRSLAVEEPLLQALPRERARPESEDGPRVVVSDLEGALVDHVRLMGREKLTVGRSRRCDLTVADPAVSRLHCVLYLEGERWCIADADSSGGTRVEGRLMHRRRLEDHMLARIGSHLLRVEGSRLGSGAVEGEAGPASPVHLSAFLGHAGRKPIEILDGDPAMRPSRQTRSGEGSGRGARWAV